MQPYLFPYIGYFQLMHAADRFVVYDDVNYIKQGWINRNRILVNDEPHLFTMPLAGAGSFTLINAIGLDGTAYSTWRAKFLKTLAQAYRKAPYAQSVMPVVERALLPDRTSLAELLLDSLRAVMEHVGISTTLIPSSSVYANKHLGGQERILDICAQEAASEYVNPIGGVELYAKADFEQRGLRLWFLKSRLREYAQFGGPFQPGLSIIDAMMFNPPEVLREMLDEYDEV